MDVRVVRSNLLLLHVAIAVLEALRNLQISIAGETYSSEKYDRLSKSVQLLYWHVNRR